MKVYPDDPILRSGNCTEDKRGDMVQFNDKPSIMTNHLFFVGKCIGHNDTLKGNVPGNVVLLLTLPKSENNDIAHF